MVAYVVLIGACLSLVAVLWLRVHYLRSVAEGSVAAPSLDTKGFLRGSAQLIELLAVIPLMALAAGATLSIWQARPIVSALFDGALISLSAAAIVMVTWSVLRRAQAGETLLEFPRRGKGCALVAFLGCMILLVVSVALASGDDVVVTRVDMVREHDRNVLFLLVFAFMIANFADKAFH